MDPSEAILRYHTGFGDLDKPLHQIWVNLFYRPNLTETFNRPWGEWRIIQYYINDDSDTSPKPLYTAQEYVQFAKGIYQSEEEMCCDDDEKMEDPIDPLRHPAFSFSEWVKLLFQVILRIECSTLRKNAIGCTFVGKTNWGTCGHLRLISERGGNITGTDYNAIFMESLAIEALT